MTNFSFSDNQRSDVQPITEERLGEILEERFDVEALAQMVEHLDYASKLSGKLTSAFNDVRGQTGRLNQVVGAIQQEIRDLIMDVTMLKRALVSLGHVGVMERRKIEKELVRELFPPTQPRPGAGMMVNTAQPKPPQKVDCENRLHLCKAACCRIFNVHLTPQEVLADNLEWDPRHPYAMPKNRVGCTYLQSGGCGCTIYQSRPNTCTNYSCANDGRIWQDFENKIINPDLAKRLATLDVNTKPVSADLEVQFNRLPTSAAVPHSPASSLRTAPLPLATDSVSPVPIGMPEKPNVAPPNFEELRKLIIPKPAKQFVPPKKKEGGNEKAVHSGNGQSE